MSARFLHFSHSVPKSFNAWVLGEKTFPGGETKQKKQVCPPGSVKNHKTFSLEIIGQGKGQKTKLSQNQKFFFCLVRNSPGSPFGCGTIFEYDLSLEAFFFEPERKKKKRTHVPHFSNGQNVKELSRSTHFFLCVCNGHIHGPKE